MEASIVTVASNVRSLAGLCDPAAKTSETPAQERKHPKRVFSSSLQPPAPWRCKKLLQQSSLMLKSRPLCLTTNHRRQESNSGLNSNAGLPAFAICLAYYFPINKNQV